MNTGLAVSINRHYLHKTDHHPFHQSPLDTLLSHPRHQHSDYSTNNRFITSIPNLKMSSQHSGTIGLTPAMVANIRATMMNVEGFKVNWAGVKQATGVSSNGNA